MAELTPELAAEILADLHARFGDDAFLTLCLHACAEDLNSSLDPDDEDAEPIAAAELDADDIHEWASGVAEGMVEARNAVRNGE